MKDFNFFLPWTHAFILLQENFLKQQYHTAGLWTSW